MSGKKLYDRSKFSDKEKEIDLPTQNLELILKPLSNPSRQELLILLANGPVTYTELLQQMGIESGSFYWHIGKMKLLVSQNDLKEYQLSDLGRKAYELLVFDGSPPTEVQPFRPSWYLNLYRVSTKLYRIPSWILIQQVFIIIFVAGYLFDLANLLQIGTIPIQSTNDNPMSISVISILGSILFITTGIVIMQILYIRPDREYFRKSLLSFSIKIAFSSSLLLLTGIIYSGMIELGYHLLVNNPIFQLLLSMIVLSVAILSSTTVVDQFLDLGLKDSLLIILPPYYVIVLISFFLSSLIV